MSDTAKSYPHTIEIDVTFRDLDVLGHVNNAVYLTYMETARIRFVIDLLDLKEPRELPVILAEATVSYKSPALFGERLIVGSGISRFGNKSFDMVHRVESEGGRLVALGTTVLVAYDHHAARSLPVPESFKERVRAFQGEWPGPA